MGTTRKCDFPVFDADNHLYETKDAFTRHLPEHRRRDVYWITDERGHRHLVFDRQLYDYIHNPTFDPVAVAGAFDRKQVEPIALRPEYRDRDMRIASLDEQGVEGALLFPTLINGLEERIGANVPLYYDVMWAYDRWLEEDDEMITARIRLDGINEGFAALKTALSSAGIRTGIISWRDNQAVDRLIVDSPWLRQLVWVVPGRTPVAEVRRRLDAGHVGLKLHPSFDRFPADDGRLDPYLRLAREARVPVAVHSAPGNADPDRIRRLADRHP